VFKDCQSSRLDCPSFPSGSCCQHEFSRALLLLAGRSTEKRAASYSTEPIVTGQCNRLLLSNDSKESQPSAGYYTISSSLISAQSGNCLKLDRGFLWHPVYFTTIRMSFMETFVVIGLSHLLWCLVLFICLLKHTHLQPRTSSKAFLECRFTLQALKVEIRVLRSLVSQTCYFVHLLPWRSLK
jgi:hypothetical protein